MSEMVTPIDWRATAAMRAGMLESQRGFTEQAEAERDAALDQRDDARDLAAEYEAEIAQMQPIYDLAIEVQRLNRAYREACKDPGQMHVAAQLFADRQHAVIALWNAS